MDPKKKPYFTNIKLLKRKYPYYHSKDNIELNNKLLKKKLIINYFEYMSEYRSIIDIKKDNLINIYNKKNLSNIFIRKY